MRCDEPRTGMVHLLQSTNIGQGHECLRPVSGLVPSIVTYRVPVLCNMLATAK